MVLPLLNFLITLVYIYNLLNIVLELRKKDIQLRNKHRELRKKNDDFS